jgi:hypothetical protein
LCVFFDRTLSQFVEIEWIGSEVDHDAALGLSEFTPLLHSFISKHLTISLSSQASHPSQVSHHAILDDLDSSQRRSHSRSSSVGSDSSDGSFVDLLAQYQEQSTAAPAPAAVEPPPAIATTEAVPAAEVKAEPLQSPAAAELMAKYEMFLKKASGALSPARADASVSVAPVEAAASSAAEPEEDIVTPESVEEEARARAVPRKSPTGSPSGSPAKSPAASPSKSSNSGQARKTVGSLFNRLKETVSSAATPSRKPPVPTQTSHSRTSSGTKLPATVLSQPVKSVLLRPKAASSRSSTPTEGVNGSPRSSSSKNVSFFGAEPEPEERDLPEY